MSNPRAWRWAGRILLVLVLAAFYAPIAMVFVYSFNASKLGSVWTGFSTEWYDQLFSRPELWEGLRTSLVVGFLASTISVCLGTLAALGMRHWRRRAKRLAAGLLALPLVIPEILLGVALALFFHS